MRPHACRLSLVLALVQLLAGSSGANVVREAAQRLDQAQSVGSQVAPADKRRPIFFSEYKLRSVVEQTNSELRQLKRDFMRQTTDIYLRLKLDPTLGFEVVRDSASPAASANLLLAEELATTLVKKHIIQRRLFTGLKLAFTKFLPMQTLVNLYRRYESFSWLKDQQQVELRPKFPNAQEKHFIALYSLIELRGRVRAADDVLALTSDNLRRVLQVVSWYLVESNHGLEVSAAELDALARNAKLVLEFFSSELFDWNERLHEAYDKCLETAAPLARMLGGQAKLVEFVDGLIDQEALDVFLSGEAKSLEYPPTINEQIIVGLQKSWIPWYVLKSVEEDRRALVTNRKRVLHLMRADTAKWKSADLADWTARMLEYVCHNDVVVYGRK